MRTGIPLMDRRALLLGAGTSVVASGVRSQVLAEVTDDPHLTDIQLTRNLFTRVSTDVMINGQGPFSFVIDTGSVSTAVANTVVRQLELPPRAPLIVHGIASAAVTPSVEVDRLHLRGLRKRALHCPVFDREQMGADGLIGLDVLDRFRLSFNTQRRTATLARVGMRISTGGVETMGSRLSRDTVRSVRGRFGQLIMTNLQICGQTVSAFVDSGAQYSIGNQALRRVIETRRPSGLSSTKSFSVLGVTGQSTQADVARVDDLRIGHHRLGPATLLFADLYCFDTLGLSGRPALLIGADLLGRFQHVAINFASNAVTFDGVRPPSIHPLDGPPPA